MPNDHMPRVNVKITAKNLSGIPTRVVVNGMDISQLVLKDHFAVHFASDEHEETYVVLALPVDELELEVQAVLHAIAANQATGEVA